MNSDEYKAQCAGTFDGDGSVVLYNESLRVEITNTYLPRLLILKDAYGGGVSPDYRKVLIGWRWQVSGHNAFKFLSDIFEYSVIKFDQIALALNYFKNRGFCDWKEYQLNIHNLKLVQYSDIDGLATEQFDQFISRPMFSTYPNLGLAWLAGLVDTDGSINIQGTSGPKEHEVLNFRIGVSFLPAMMVVKEFTKLGPKLVRVTPKKKDGSVAGNFSWGFRLVARGAAEVIQKIQPYLLIKQDQARLALEYQTSKFARGRNQYMEGNDTVFQRQSEIIDELQSTRDVEFESEEEARKTLAQLANIN